LLIFNYLIDLNKQLRHSIFYILNAVTLSNLEQILIKSKN
jgi:hypothetical protein